MKCLEWLSWNEIISRAQMFKSTRARSHSPCLMTCDPFSASLHLNTSETLLSRRKTLLMNIVSNPLTSLLLSVGKRAGEIYILVARWGCKRRCSQMKFKDFWYYFIWFWLWDFQTSFCKTFFWKIVESNIQLSFHSKSLWEGIE